MKVLRFIMAAALLLCFVVLPGCGGEDEPSGEKQAEKAEAKAENKEEAIKKIDEKMEKLVLELEDGDISEEEFAEKIDALEAARKELTREETEKHWEEQRQKMRSQYEGYLEKEKREREKAASGN